jgi:hypothetical protein
MLKSRLVLKRDKVIGELRRLHNKEFYALLVTTYYVGNQIKKIDGQGI